MGEELKHDCGIALIRLLKPLQYYEQKYGTPLYGFNLLFLLMEKQHNRGQDGAGIGAVKLNVTPGQPYMFRERVENAKSLDIIFTRLLDQYNHQVRNGIIIPEFPQTVKEHFDFGAEALIGHLRYGTSGSYNKESLHPYIRRSNWPTKNLMVVGNFTMTNTKALNDSLIERGQHPIFETDTQTILEEIGFYLDEEHTKIYRAMRDSGIAGKEIPEIISGDLDVAKILNQAARVWDGGYSIAGLIGNGDTFVMRDPHGIRPCFYFKNEEIVAFASERVPLMTVFEQSEDSIKEVPPGHVIVLKSNGEFIDQPFTEPKKKLSCSFERIYFSRGNDPDIYLERKALGAALVSQINEEIDHDLEHTVFSYIPNTAETAYYGLMDALHYNRREEVKSAILEAGKNGKIDDSLLDGLIMNNWPRGEKIAHKDIKLRTFISQEKGRNQLVSHVYDVTYGVVRPDDNLVCMEDSIVRGTTLKQSIIKILSRTNPKKIVIASTAPQIRYPDCYGIDMSELGKFIAFQAAVELLKDKGKSDLLLDVYQDCIRQAEESPEKIKNHVLRIYEPHSTVEISNKIAELIRPKEIEWDGEIAIIYQNIENLHKSIPEHSGDWYFTGDYPTLGGYKVLNRAYINYYEDKKGRSYDISNKVIGNE